jgi:DNA-binding NarL/FixJ family response regulator
MAVRVVVADDHAGFRKALVTTLGLVNGVEVIAEATDGLSAAATAIEMEPDVVLMDLSMPGLSGIEAMVRIHRRRPDIPVIILTAHAEPGIEREAMASGAQAFLAKGGSLQEMIDALLDVELDRPVEELGGA